MLSTGSGTGSASTEAKPQNTAKLGGIDNKKILVVGSQRSGKTCLVNRFTTDNYHTDAGNNVQYQATLGADLTVKFLVEGENRLSLSIWSLGGQPRYQSILTQFYTDDVSAILICVDLLNESSLEAARELAVQAKDNCPTALLYMVGTKADEVDKIIFKMPELTKAAEEVGAVAFKTTSAKAGSGITDVFDDICQRLRTL